MEETFGSTCHGAGRACSRNNSRNNLQYQQVLDALKTKGISIRWGRAGQGRAGRQQMHSQHKQTRTVPVELKDLRLRGELLQLALKTAHPALPPLFTCSLRPPFPRPAAGLPAPSW
jgi:hypothetical protein